MKLILHTIVRFFDIHPDFILIVQNTPFHYFWNLCQDRQVYLSMIFQKTDGIVHHIMIMINHPMFLVFMRSRKSYDFERDII